MAGKYSAAVAVALCAAVFLASIQHSEAGGFEVPKPIDGVVLFRDGLRAPGANVDCTPPEGEHDSSIYETTTDGEGEFSLPNWAADPHPVNDPPGVISTVCTASVVVNGTTFTGSVSLVLFVDDENGLSDVVIFVDRTTIEANDDSVGSATYVDLFNPDHTVQGVVMGEDDETVVMVRDAPKPVVMENAESQIQRLRSEENIRLKNTTVIVRGKCCSTTNGNIRLTNASNLSFENSVSFESNDIELQDSSLLRLYSNASVIPNVRELAREVKPCTIGRFARVQTEESSVTNFEVPLWIQPNGTFSATEDSTVNFRPPTLRERVADHLNYGPARGPIIVNDGEFSAMHSSTINIDRIPIFGFGSTVVAGAMDIDNPEVSSRPLYVNNWNVTWGGALTSNHRLICPKNCSAWYNGAFGVNAAGRMMVGDSLSSRYGGRINISTSSFVAGKSLEAGESGEISIGRFSGSSFDGSSVRIGIAPMPDSPSRRRLHTSFSVLFEGKDGDNYHVDDDDFFEPVYSPGRFGSSVAVSSGGSIAIAGVERTSVSQGGISVRSGGSIVFTNISTIEVDVSDLYISDSGTFTLNTLDTLDESSFVNTGKAFFSNGCEVDISGLYTWNSGTWSGSGTTVVDGSLEVSSSASVSLTAGRFSSGRGFSVESGGRFALRSDNVTIDDSLNIVYSGSVSMTPLAWNNGNPMFPTTVRVNVVTSFNGRRRTLISDDEECNSDFTVSQGGSLTIGTYDYANVSVEGEMRVYDSGAVYIHSRSLALSAGRFAVETSGEAEFGCEEGEECTFDSGDVSVASSGTLIFVNVSHWESGSVSVSESGVLDVQSEITVINGTLDIYSGGTAEFSTTHFSAFSLSLREGGTGTISGLGASSRTIQLSDPSGIVSNLTVTYGSSLFLGASLLTIHGGNFETSYGSHVTLNVSSVRVGDSMGVFYGSSLTAHSDGLTVRGDFGVYGSSSVVIEGDVREDSAIEFGSAQCPGFFCHRGRFSISESSSVSFSSGAIHISEGNFEILDSSDVNFYSPNVGSLYSDNATIASSARMVWSSSFLNFRSSENLEVTSGGSLTLNGSTGILYVSGDVIVHQGSALTVDEGTGEIDVGGEVVSFDGGYIGFRGQPIAFAPGRAYNGGTLEIDGYNVTTGSMSAYWGGDIKINSTDIYTSGDISVHDSAYLQYGASGRTVIVSNATHAHSGGEVRISTGSIHHEGGSISLHDGGYLTIEASTGTAMGGALDIYNGGTYIVGTVAEFGASGGVVVHSSGTVKVESSRASFSGCGHIYYGSSVIVNSSFILPEQQRPSFSWSDAADISTDDADFYCGNTDHFLTVHSGGGVYVNTIGTLDLQSSRTLRVYNGGVAQFETEGEIGVRVSNISMYAGSVTFSSVGGSVRPGTVEMSGSSSISISGSTFIVDGGNIEMIEASLVSLRSSSLEVTSGSLQLSESSVVSLVVSNASIPFASLNRGGTIDFSGDSTEFFTSDGIRATEGGSVHFTGAGSVTIGHRGLRFHNASSGTFSSSALTVTGGNLQLNDHASLEIEGSQIQVNGGNFLMSDNSEFYITGSSISISGSIQINSSTLRVAGQGRFAPSVGGSFTNSSIIVEGGNVIFSDSSVVSFDDSEFSVEGGNIEFGNGGDFRASQGSVGSGTILTLKGENFGVSKSSNIHVHHGGAIYIQRGSCTVQNGSTITGTGTVEMTDNANMYIPTSNMTLGVHASDGSTVELSSTDRNHSLTISSAMQFTGSFFTVNANFIHVEGGSVELQDSSSLTIEPYDDGDFFTYSQRGSVLSIAAGSTFGSAEVQGNVLVYGATIQTRAFESGSTLDTMDFHVHDFDLDRDSTMTLDYGNLHLSGSLRPRMGAEGMRVHSLRSASSRLDDGQPLVEVASAPGDSHEPYGEFTVTAGTTVHLADDIDNNGDGAPDVLRCGHLVVEAGATLYLHGVAIDCREYTVEGQMVDVA